MKKPSVTLSLDLLDHETHPITPSVTANETAAIPSRVTKDREAITCIRTAVRRAVEFVMVTRLMPGIAASGEDCGRVRGAI